MRSRAAPHHLIRRLLLLALPLFASPVSSLKCEVCSSEEMRDGLASIKLQFPNQNSFPPCGPKAQLLECPENYKAGCLTQTKGRHVSKMCSNIPVEDCQAANSIEYCYCRGELCNKQQQSPTPSNQVPKAVVTRRPPTTAYTPASTKAPRAPKPTLVEDLGSRNLEQVPTAGPEQSGSGLGSAAGPCRPSHLAGLVLALLVVCRHILTPNIAF